MFVELTVSRIDTIDVVQEGPTQIVPVNTFADAGLHPVMLENVALCGYDNPTPIQKYTIPSMLQGHDVIGIAQTGKLNLFDVGGYTNKLRQVLARRPLT